MTNISSAASTRPRPRDWFAAAIIAGLAATVAVSVVLVGTFMTARGLGVQGAAGLAGWMWNLTHNPVVDFTTSAPYLLLQLHIFFGVAWAVIYAALFEPRLTGPAWVRGILFSLLPWVGSLVVFLPLTGASLFGLAIAAGPLPVLGNLLLHLVYGGVLGFLYAMALPGHPGTEGLGLLAEEVSEPFEALMRAQRGAAIGIAAGGVGGLVAGFIVGLVFRSSMIVPQLAAVMPLLGLILGAALGSLIGTMAMANPPPGGEREENRRRDRI